MIAVVALQQAVPPAPVAAPATQPVIVARQHIDARQVILPEQLQTKNMLLSEVPSGAIFRIEDAEARNASPKPAWGRRYATPRGPAVRRAEDYSQSPLHR